MSRSRKRYKAGDAIVFNDAGAPVGMYGKTDRAGVIVETDPKRRRVWIRAGAEGRSYLWVSYDCIAHVDVAMRGSQSYMSDATLRAVMAARAAVSV